MEHTNDILKWDLRTLSNSLQNKQISPLEVTRLLLERIDQVNPHLNAYITVLREESLEAAAHAENEIMQGNWKGPLHGIPIGLKDLIYTKNYRTTMGSELYKDYVAKYDATVVEKLMQAGAIIIGKLNTHQFAYGPTGDRSFFGPVKNPYNLTKMTGGSSSGSGAAVAAALCSAALGTDTGGSIRIPASCCGIVGMKPTFGRVSKYGVFPLSWTLDHIGPLTRTVTDNAMLLNVLVGYDDRDPYSARTEQEDFTNLLGQDIRGTVIGVPSCFYFDNIDPEVKAAVRNALEVFAHLGADIREVDVPDMHKISYAQQITMRSEAYTVHQEELHNRPELYEPEVRERLLTGVGIKANEYVESQQIKHSAKQEFLKAFEHVDVLIAPTLPILPPDIGQREVTVKGQREHVRSALTRLTGPTNFTGLPSISVPCGFSAYGLPIGMQLIGNPFDEANLYRFAYAFEQEAALPTVKYEINYTVQ